MVNLPHLPQCSRSASTNFFPNASELTRKPLGKGKLHQTPPACPNYGVDLFDSGVRPIPFLLN